MTRALRACLQVALLGSLSLLAARAECHSVDAATLTLTEVAPGEFTIEWKTAAPTLARLDAPALYPKHCIQSGARLDCSPLGLMGSIELPWLEGGDSRVTVVIDWLSGKRQLRVVNGGSPGFGVYGASRDAGWRFLLPIAKDYTRLGVEHILTGFDHLMFVLAVTVLVRERRALLVALSAFTLAHSLTLAGAVLGWLRFPVAPVETAIALSVVLACTECLRTTESLARRKPWLVTFAFGLLHGMGFASALAESGLPERHLLSALSFFNLGVEVGQLAALALFLVVRRLATVLLRRPAWSERALVYAMGCTAAYWSLERGAEMLAGWTGH